MKRTEARENLMMLIYQMDAQNDYSEESAIPFIDNYMEGSDQMNYFNTVLEQYKENRLAVDDKIESCSSGWHIGRMGKVDLAILRLAVTELCFMNDAKDGLKAPVGAAINEAVELAKKYGSEDSGKFVNGVLGKVARSL